MKYNIHTLFSKNSTSHSTLRGFCFVSCFTFCSFCATAQYNAAVIITEIMPDPSPAVGLPEAEYLELYNRGTSRISLKNMRLSLGTRSAILPEYLLDPEEYLIVCHTSNIGLFAGMGKTLGISNFNLPNDGSDLTVYDAHGKVLSHISYSVTWWPETKRSGGYALEIIDTDNLCSGISNWKISDDRLGGTPGKPNSVRHFESPSPEHFCIERIELRSASEFSLFFNEKLDSLSVQQAVFLLSGKKVQYRRLVSPDFKEIRLAVDSPFQEEEVGRVEIKGLKNCADQPLTPFNLTLGNAASGAPGDVIINEILFHPFIHGVDFIELFNRSDKIISLKNWTLGNIRFGQPDVFRTVTTDDVLLLPFDHIALSIAPDVVKTQYPTHLPRKFLKMASLPSYPNTAGGTIIRMADERISDQVTYHESLHHQLINNPKGVSLELSSYESTDNTALWHSASGLAGYGTPGYRNTQNTDNKTTESFVLDQEAFSPNGDGFEDHATLRYTAGTAGTIASVTIFNHLGKFIKTLVKNQTAGITTTIQWDGSNENGEIVPTGYYLILAETFDLTGRKAVFRKKIVVIR